MLNGVRMQATLVAHAAAFEAQAKANSPPDTEAQTAHLMNLKRTAYQWRVMLSHVREKHSAWLDLLEESREKELASHPPELRELYELTTDRRADTRDPECSPSPSPIRDRPHPFSAFRPPSSSVPEEPLQHNVRERDGG